MNRAAASVGDLIPRPWRWGIALGVVGLLALSAVTWTRSRTSAEDHRAAAWIAGRATGTSAAVFSDRPLNGADVSAAALARALVRPDTFFIKPYKAGRDLLPSWLRKRLPWPMDERFRGAAASLGLMNHADAGEAFPILAAAVTDPKCANRDQAIQALNYLGVWLPEAMLAHAMKDLAGTNPPAQLRALEPLARVWPGQPDLDQRIKVLRRAQQSPATSHP